MHCDQHYQQQVADVLVSYFNGARRASAAARATAEVGLCLVSVAAIFEGEFFEATRSCAGMGVVR